MSRRLIDANELISVLYEYEHNEGGLTAYVAQCAINTAPSIDIVFCKECRWGKPYSDKQLECDALGLGGLKFPNDFCSYGEREGE